MCVLVAQSSPTLCDLIGGGLPGFSFHGILQFQNSPGKNTGVDCHCLLQRNLPTQGSNPGVLHCRQFLYRLSYREVLVRVNTSEGVDTESFREHMTFKEVTDNREGTSVCLWEGEC